MTPGARLTRHLEERRAAGRKLFVPYLMSGFPTRARFRELASFVLANGADALEIGVPFSDPLADGPVIQAAGQRALEQGVGLEAALEDSSELAARFPDVPLLLMSYVNPLRAHGLARAAKNSRSAGLCGWIVPDRDLLDPAEVLEPAARSGLAVVPLVAPTTPAGRLPSLLAGAGGFVYVVSVTGVTGARRGQRFVLGPTLQRLRRRTRLPLCVGFGIASGEQAAQACRLADGVVVGSALLEPFLDGTFARARERLRALFEDLRRGLDRMSVPR
jgi:tryptophan synthase alpha chain